MKQAPRKFVPAAMIFLLYVIIALISDDVLHLFGNHVTSRVVVVSNYALQILAVLSGLFLLIRLSNIFVWDSLVTRALGSPVPRLIKDLSALLICLIGMMIIVGVVFEQPVMGIWATSGAFGLVIGFALRSLILDMFTGLAPSMLTIPIKSAIGCMFTPAIARSTLVVSWRLIGAPHNSQPRITISSSSRIASSDNPLSPIFRARVPSVALISIFASMPIYLRSASSACY
jgi:hypothetical protein